MTVRKFRDVSEMADTLWHEPGAPELIQAIRRVWDFAERTGHPRFPPGVYKHRTIEDVQRLREQWEEANFRSYWERLSRRRQGSSSARPGGSGGRSTQTPWFRTARMKRPSGGRPFHSSRV